MAPAIGFELPVNRAWLDTPGQPSFTPGELPAEAIDHDTWAVITSEQEAGLQPQLFYADSGRGASGIAIAVEYVIDGINTYGGAMALVIQAAYGTRAVWRRLSHHLGHHPNVSLGAAIHLAAADFIDRTGDHDFMLVGSHDIDSSPHDAAYTGLDVFSVVFSSHRQLHFYAVEADGRVHYLGQIQRPDPYGHHEAPAGPDTGLPS